MCNNYKLKSWDELTFTDDYMFKLVMSKHPKFISKLLEIILQIKVKDIKFHETEKNLKESYDGHGIRFDLYVEDTDLLVQKSGKTYLQYNKRCLNRAYLQDKIKNKILNSIHLLK